MGGCGVQQAATEGGVGCRKRLPRGLVGSRKRWRGVPAMDGTAPEIAVYKRDVSRHDRWM